MANTTNIAPLITPEISATLTSSDQIISFGEQLIKQQAQQVVIGVAQTLIKNKLASLSDTIEKTKQAGLSQGIIIKNATTSYANKKITKEQYDEIVANAKTSFQESIATIKANKKRSQEGLTNENSLTKNIQAEAKKIKLENTKLKANTAKADIRAKADLAKSILKNPKTLLLIYPGLGLLITNAFLNFISQRKKLEKQVEVVNLYIDTRVIDEPSVIIATNLKNNTIKAINDAIKKLQAIEAIIKTINTALKIASVALLILTLIPIPVPMPILKLFDKLSNIISGLSAIISVCATILAEEIRKLKELIERLKQIIIKLNNKTLAILTDAQLLNLIQNTLPLGDVNPFPTLTAIPVSGSAGFVNIGGRIVPLNSTNAAGSIAPSLGNIAGGASTVTPATGATGIGTSSLQGTGTGVGIGTGIGIGGVGTGSAGTGTGVGIGGTGTGGTGTGTGVGGTGVGTGTGTGGIGTGIINPPTINANNLINQVVTGSVGSTNGTGIGITTTGGKGTGGVNIGPTGIIPTNNNTGISGSNAGLNNSNVNGNGLGLDNGITSGLDVDGQPILSIDLNQFAVSGLDEVTLDQLESFSLETLEDPQSLTSTPQIPSLSNQINLYKGFKFQIKEEQDPRFVVRGFKRRYAVAINRQGIEVLKSEYSFTLDPNDLVDQLKLIIDKQKLQG